MSAPLAPRDGGRGARLVFGAAALLIAGLALGLRLALAGRGGLWIDETQLLWTTRIDGLAEEMLRFVATQDSHPPLYYLLMRGWLRLAGDTEATALAPGLVFGVLGVLALAWVGRAVFTPGTGLVAALLAACAPLLAWHAAEARPYAFMGLLCVASTYALWRALLAGGRGEGRPLGAWAAYAVVMVAMLWTHHWAWLVWGGHGVVALAWLALGAGPARARRGAVAAGGAAAQVVIVLAACVPLAPMLLYQSRHAGHGPASISPGLLKATVSWLVFSFEEPALDVVLLAMFVALALAAARAFRHPGCGGSGHETVGAERGDGGGGRGLLGGQWLGLALYGGAPLLAVAAAAALSRRNNLLVPHTLVMIAPCLTLAVAHVVATLGQWVPAAAPAPVRAVPAAAVSALLAGTHLNVLANDRFVKTNAREVAAAVAARATPDDLTLVQPQWYGSSFYAYYPLDRPRLDYPVSPFTGAFPYVRVAERLATAETFDGIKDQLADARRAGRRIWLVIDRRWADPSEGGRLPPHVLPGSYREVAFRRAEQLRLELESLYGPGVEVLPRDGRPGWSMMHVLAYEPPGGVGGPADRITPSTRPVPPPSRP